MKRLTAKCTACEWRYECSNKRFETIGYYPIAAEIQQRYTEPIASEILVKHDYRCFDCPYCGCQSIANIRRRRVSNDNSAT